MSDVSVEKPESHWSPEQASNRSATRTHRAMPAAKRSACSSSPWRRHVSTAGDLRDLTPLVLMSALRAAGTVVHEPVHRFRLDLPADLFGPLLPVLTRLGAIPAATAARGPAYTVEGDVPAARVHELETRFPSLTRGEGVLETAFDHDPLDRKEYLLHVQRRV